VNPPATPLAQLLHYLSTDKITGRTAKTVLAELFVSRLYKRYDTAKGII
jgi:aspartyl-tRNA(Asn)/glutamyl-tRNA(Gln) amidotransferase subunit B